MLMKYLFDDLQKLDLNIVNDFEIRELFAKFKEFGVIVFKIPKGRHIYRSLKMKSENDRFWNKERISFNPYPSNYGRANLPNKPIFYGSITTEKEYSKRLLNENDEFQNTVHGYFLNVLECSEILGSLEKEGKEFFTIGMWEVKEDIEVIVIHDENDRNHLSIELKIACKNFFNQLSEDRKELFTSLHSFLSKEFSKKVLPENENQYKISANFSQHIIDIGLSGILYPSVKAEGEGFNVALNPKLFENGTIELKRAGVVKLFANKEKEILWDWTENAEYFNGEPLVYKKVDGITLDKEELLCKLEKLNIIHLL
jgi:hypothetical protein